MEAINRRFPEQQHPDSEDKFRIFLDYTDDLVTQVDAAGRIIYVNHTAESIFGLPPDKCIGLSAFDFVHPDDLEATRASFQNWLNQRLASVTFENRQCNLKSGGTSHVRWTININWKEDGTLSHINSIGHDLTVLKQTESLLRFQTRQLAERVKELNCLYRISRIIAQPELDFEETLIQILQILPSGLQYPDITAARVRIEGQEWQTTNYKTVSWTMGCVVRMDEEIIGNVEVVYLEMKPPEDEGPFLKEERDLILAVAAQLAQVVKRHRSERRLKREMEIKVATAELASTLITSASFKEICDIVLDFSQKITKSPFGFVGYLDPSSGYLISPTMPSHIWESCRVPDKSFVFQHFSGLWGWVLLHKKPLLTNTPNQDPRSTGIPQGHLPIHRFLSVPALVGGELVGQIALANAEQDYVDSDLIYIQQVAALFAIAVQRQRSEDKLNELNQALEKRVQVRTAALETEIQERRLFESRLSESKKILQAVVDGISDPLIMVDRNLRVMLLNTAAMKYYQVEFRDAIGKPCHEAFHMQPNPCQGCRVIEVLDRGNQITFERKKATGAERFEQVVVYPVFAEAMVSGAVIHVNDITDAKKIQAQLVRADRLSSLGQLSGGIAHEIRNPLAGISLFTDILGDTEKFERSEQELEIIREIRSNIGKINAIIRQVLDFARPAVEKKAELDINRLIQECLKLWNATLTKNGIHLRLSLQQGLPKVSGNAIGIQQVITNLIQNAVEAMAETGGQLDIESKHSENTLQSDLGVVRILVKDRGPGIKPKDLENIFNPFFTTKPAGTGLGLAISHQIIQLHDGRILVDTSPGKGTLFTIELPLFNGEKPS